MTELERAGLSAKAARIAVAGVIIAGGALGTAGQAGADPGEPYPTPVPGQPVAVPVEEPVGPPPPPPVGPPPVPEVSTPVYGQGQTPGQFGYLRDIWHAAHSGDPVGALSGPPQDAPGPPPGAGPPPPLPPGFISLTAPESSTPGVGYGSGPDSAGPPLPPGYHSLNEPPPPGWYDSPPEPDAAAPPTLAPVPPAP